MNNLPSINTALPIQPKKARTILSSMGISGVLKSARLSMRYCGRPDRIILGKNTKADIKPGSSFKLQSPFLMGVLKSAPVTPKTDTSRIEIHNDGELRTTSDGVGRIGAGSVVRVEGEFQIGKSFITGNAMVLAAERITIGSGCAISWNVTLIDTDRHTLMIDDSSVQSPDPIKISDDVWIGHDTTITKGVTVNKGSVVASNSVVTKDVPANSLVAGSPAEVKETSVNWQ